MESQSSSSPNQCKFRDPYDDEDCPTSTSSTQIDTENAVEQCLKAYFSDNLFLGHCEPKLLRNSHAEYLKGCLRELPTKFQHLDCSRTWLCYWIMHSLYLLNREPSDSVKEDIIQFLSRCQSDSGGFGGGPGQMPHLAPTYAAVLCIAIIGTPDAYSMINREKLFAFLLSMKREDGSFAMHQGGEVDVRAVYCALVAATLTNLPRVQLFHHSAGWIARCQTYEGGFAGYPGMEAHGGYSFCAVAALTLLDALRLVDLDALLRWSVGRQMRFEGGFQGRTNKLVDGCYSFWQGATVILATLSSTLLSEGEEGLKRKQDEEEEGEGDGCLFDSSALQQYILLCCQQSDGGLRDKPNTSRDCYHTCYALGGLALAQHPPLTKASCYGHSSNSLPGVHPVFNVGAERISSMIDHFRSPPNPPEGT